MGISVLNTHMKTPISFVAICRAWPAITKKYNNHNYFVIVMLVVILVKSHSYVENIFEMLFNFYAI